MTKVAFYRKRALRNLYTTWVWGTMGWTLQDPYINHLYLQNPILHPFAYHLPLSGSFLLWPTGPYVICNSLPPRAHRLLSPSLAVLQRPLFCPLNTPSLLSPPLQMVLFSLPGILFAEIRAWPAPHFPRVRLCTNIAAERTFLSALDKAALSQTPGYSLCVWSGLIFLSSTFWRPAYTYLFDHLSVSIPSPPHPMQSGPLLAAVFPDQEPHLAYGRCAIHCCKMNISHMTSLFIVPLRAYEVRLAPGTIFVNILSNPPSFTGQVDRSWRKVIISPAFRETVQGLGAGSGERSVSLYFPC